MTIFIERLTFGTWCLSVLPWLLRQPRQERQETTVCYVFDGSRVGMAVARMTQGLAAASVQRFAFRLYDLHDEEGQLLALRMLFRDLAAVQADALDDPLVVQALRELADGHRLRVYLGKAMVAADSSGYCPFFRALATVQVGAWKVRSGATSRGRVVLILQRQPWMAVIRRYGARYGIEVVAMAPRLTFRSWLLATASPELLSRLRAVRAWGSLQAVRHLLAHVARHGVTTGGTGRNRLPRIAVEYWGQLNLEQPERYSDLFFWQQSSLSAADVLVVFRTSRDPLDELKMASLAAHGLSGVALDPHAAMPGLPVFINSPWSGQPAEVARPPMVRQGRTTEEGRWLHEQFGRYRAWRASWAALCRRQDVRIYISWYRHDPAHCAVADALRDVGGLTVLYERSYPTSPSADGATVADIVFGFSREGAEVERLAGSTIPYYVVTGYLGDHRFAMLRREAMETRARLARQGVSRVLAFFDENSSDDARWASGHELTRTNYAFLLERVLSTPWLGLLLKPKVPSTLRRRLGPVAKLLEQAVAMGRCVLYEAGRLHNAYPPAAAALAADVAVHGHLFAATAGVEAALAGVPTLLLDQEGWPESVLYRLGVGRVVFNDWPSLWRACTEHWRGPGGVAGFGDWSPMLDELDPFRDGRAAERMGTYLQWLLEGFKAGRDRLVVMAEAAHRYRRQWGQDTIISVNADTADGALDDLSCARDLTAR